MSLDDRLSPQSMSSQSPPPASHSLNLMLQQAHHLHQQHQQHQHTIKNLFFQQKNISPTQKEMSLHMLNQAKDILNLSSSSLPASPSSSSSSSSSRLSLSPSPSLVKSENCSMNMSRNDRDHTIDTDDDEDQEIEVDDDEEDAYRKASSMITNSINFSISNILSDTFGKRNNQQLAQLCSRSNKKDLLFRPYEINGNNNNNNTSNNNSDNFNSFNINNTSKLPSSLGGLCKTISQIGQHVQQTIATSANFSLSNSSLLPLSRTISDSGVESSDDTRSESGCSSKDENGQASWPAWVYCTRYSDRPSSGPRYRRPKQPKDKTVSGSDDKRPRTAFSSEQLARLKQEFIENRYLTERRRQQLSNDLGLNEAQIKIWFQNKRAKIKKSTGQKNPLAMQLMAQGLYNHTTVPLTKEEEELEMRMNGQLPLVDHV